MFGWRDRDMSCELRMGSKDFIYHRFYPAGGGRLDWEIGGGDRVEEHNLVELVGD